MAACKYHPERPGVGVCMRCRAVICAACCTRLDGVNHCHACLRALSRRTTPADERDLAPAASVVLLGVSWFVLFGVLWLLQGRLAP
jgi:hypothetical protein